MTPLSTLSGMELRKAACEALGWRWVANLYDGKRFHPVEPENKMGYKPSALTLGTDDAVFEAEDLPAIESDPAVSEPLFLEFCDSRHLNWEMADRHSALASQRIYLRVWNFDGGAEIECEVLAANPSESRARCIVIASAQEVKP